MAYLIRKKSKDNVYIYLRNSTRANGRVQHEYIFSFGKMPDALDFLYSVSNGDTPFPLKLHEKGYEMKDVMEWIMTLETKRTATGRNFEV